MTDKPEHKQPVPNFYPSAKKSPRQPSQARGRQRVGVLLDACARLISEHGESSLTMHRLAGEARTSIGSLYHFFPDKNAVLNALSQRHLEALQNITGQLGTVPDEAWQRLTSEEVVKNLIYPYLEYVANHPEIQVLIQPRQGERKLRSPELQAAVRDIYDKVLTLRLPDASPDDRRTYSATMFCIPSGMFYLIPESDDVRKRVWLEEVPRALIAYLNALGSIAGAARDT